MTIPRFNFQLSAALLALGLIAEVAGDEFVISPSVLTSVRFADELHGWISGSAAVHYTENGGLSWKRFPLPVTPVKAVRRRGRANPHGYGKILVCDATSALIRSRAGLVRVTASDSQSAILGIPTTISTDQEIEDFSFFDWNQGWAIVDRDVYSSTDGGTTWSRKYHADWWLTSISAPTADRVWVASLGEGIAFTREQGESWTV